MNYLQAEAGAQGPSVLTFEEIEAAERAASPPPPPPPAPEPTTRFTFDPADIAAAFRELGAVLVQVQGMWREQRANGTPGATTMGTQQTPGGKLGDLRELAAAGGMQNADAPPQPSAARPPAPEAVDHLIGLLEIVSDRAPTLTYAQAVTLMDQLAGQVRGYAQGKEKRPIGADLVAVAERYKPMLKLMVESYLSQLSENLAKVPVPDDAEQAGGETVGGPGSKRERQKRPRKAPGA